MSLPNCDYCRRPIAGEVTKKQNNRTHEWVAFHPECFQQVLVQIRANKDEVLRGSRIGSRLTGSGLMGSTPRFRTGLTRGSSTPRSASSRPP